jgi:hypothetical protein
MIVGVMGLALAVVWIHWSSLPATETIDNVKTPLVVDYLNWWPRGIWWKAAGYLIVLGATTFVLIGACFLWLLNQRMTWSRAAVGSMIAWMAMVFYFGIVPSEWLNFAQTDLEWGIDVALVIPPALVLGNTVEISYAAIKDIIQATYSMGMLAFGVILALQIQAMKKGRPASVAKAQPKSPYGRPLVKGGS